MVGSLYLVVNALLAGYGLVSGLCISSFFKAVTTNPGKIPIGSKKERPIPKEGQQKCV